jgi:hypothetical protein
MMYEKHLTSLTVGLLLVILALPARAQMQVGDNASMNLNGNVSFGYSGGYSNYGPSTHNLSPSGNADLSGYYYSPGFLSFDVQPFYNQSRANSTYRSIFQTGGVSANTSIFSGSHFPGTVSYSKVYNSEGGFVVPGVGSLVTRGNSNSLGIGWGIQIPDYPRVSFQFADGGNASSLYGSGENATFHTRTYGVNAAHNWEGFNINGGYHHNVVDSLTPEFLIGEAPLSSHASSNTFDVSASHRLPLHGSFSIGGDHASVDSEAAGETYTATIETVSSGVGFQPITNLNVGANAQYTNDLSGSIYQSVITSGGIVPPALLNYSTHALDVNTQGSYIIPNWHLTFMGTADHREQSMRGVPISANTFSQSATYGNTLFRGFVTLSGGATQTSMSSLNSVDSHGWFGNASYLRKLDRWSFSGSVNYTRNNQTAFIGYTSSGYGYTAAIGRKFHIYSYWSANASGSKSTFNVGGSDNSAETYSTALSLRHFSVSGSYGKANGVSILTAGGLTPITNPGVGLSPLDEIVFNARTYSFGMSTTPLHGLVLSGTYSRTRSNTLAALADSRNTTAQIDTQLQYRLRQLWITGGYLKLQQEFTITGLPATSDSSFFIGITRWFNFF